MKNIEQEELKLEYYDELKWLWQIINRTMEEADERMMVDVDKS